jgi:hypothetical protein
MSKEVMNMRINILPKTSLGWWSVGLAIPVFLLFTYPFLIRLGRVVSFIGAYFNFAFIISGIAAFVIGLISIIRNKERSILVFLATLIGLFALLFLLGEVLVPH